MWTEDDKKFMRSMRIEATDPPPALPRFRVEPVKNRAGWYRVLDSERRFKPLYDFGPENFQDPRAAAEDLARQLNEKHVASS